jgi:hypothetical protein
MVEVEVSEVEVVVVVKVVLEAAVVVGCSSRYSKPM